MSSPCVLAYDLGTGGCKAALVDDTGRVVEAAFVPYVTFFPASGRHEQRVDDWWAAIVGSTRELIGGHPGLDVVAIAGSGHSLAMVPVDESGAALLDAVPIWSDTRGAAEAERFFADVDEQRWYAQTGNGFPPGMYTVFKLAWLRRTHPDIAASTFTVLGSKDWINARLTGAFATDPSYASGSGAYDLAARRYDSGVLEALGLPESWLPRIVPSAEVVGTLQPGPAEELGLPSGVPVVAGGVDNSCMALGAGLANDGTAYIALGSSNWVSLATQDPIVDATHRPFVFDHVLPGLYVSALSTFGGGSTLNWLAETIGRGGDVEALMAEAAEVPAGARGVVCVPTLAGGTLAEGGTQVRGAFLGLDLAHGHAELARAVVEGIGFSLEGAAQALFAERPRPDRFTVVGGGARAEVVLRVLAQLLGRPLARPDAEHHSAARGAAALGLAGAGVWANASRLVEGDSGSVHIVSPDPSQAAAYDRPRARFTVARAAVRDLVALSDPVLTTAESP